MHINSREFFDEFFCWKVCCTPLKCLITSDPLSQATPNNFRVVIADKENYTKSSVLKLGQKLSEVVKMVGVETKVDSTKR